MDGARSRGTPRVVVVYDFGSAAPKRMQEVAGRNGWELLFVLADTDHARSVKRALGLLGRPVLDSAGRAYEDLVADLASHGPSGIVTFSEYQLGFTARLAESLGLPYQTPAEVRTLTDKSAQRARLREAGLDDLRNHVIRRPEDVDRALAVVGLPAILKPVVGVSSRNTAQVTIEDELRLTVHQLLTGATGHAESALLLEELLVGTPHEPPWADYMAVDVIVLDGDVVPMFVTNKFAPAPPFRERGGYGPGSVEDAALVREVCDLSCAAVAAVGMRRGIAEAEVKLTPAGPRVIEVNGRLGGWVDDLARRMGIADPVEVALQCALGRTPPAPDWGGASAMAFHYLQYAPDGAVRVRSLDSPRRLRALPGVDRVYVGARPGDALDWRQGAASSLAAFWGTAPDLETLAQTVTTIESTGWFTCEFA